MNRDEFIKLYHDCTIAELCNMFNCCSLTIYRTLRKYNIPLKKRGKNVRPPKIKIEE